MITCLLFFTHAYPFSDQVCCSQYMITYLVGLHTEHSWLIKLSSNREGTSVFDALRLNAQTKNLATLKTVCCDHHRKRETDRQTDRQTDKERQTDRQRETDRQRQTDSERQTETDRDRETEKRDREKRGRERETETERDRDRQRQRETYTQNLLPTSTKDGIVTIIQPRTLLDEAG